MGEDAAMDGDAAGAEGGEANAAAARALKEAEAVI